MKIAIIAGSHRREAESARVARYLEQELKKLGINDTYLLSLSGNPLPLWDEDVWSGDENTPKPCGWSARAASST